MYQFLARQHMYSKKLSWTNKIYTLYLIVLRIMQKKIIESMHCIANMNHSLSIFDIYYYLIYKPGTFQALKTEQN